MKYLIVSDNITFRTYLREFITGKNDRYMELEDGLNVNYVYNRFGPDWVLIDILMKSTNGFYVAEKLKKEFPNARFAMMSDYSDGMFRRKSAKIGAAAFIHKENLFELVEIIQRS